MRVQLLRSIVDLLLDCFCVFLEPWDNSQGQTVFTIPELAAALASDDGISACVDPMLASSIWPSIGVMDSGEKPHLTDSMVFRGNNG
jgi:hypothetical protein